MSRIEVDDLVASFSGQHIGQEQIDLANLQAQLRLSLLACNPAAMTPSTPSPVQTPHHYHNYYHHPSQPPPPPSQPSSSSFAAAAHPGLTVHTSYPSSSALAGTNTSPISTPTQTAMPHHTWGTTHTNSNSNKSGRWCREGGGTTRRTMRGGVVAHTGTTGARQPSRSGSMITTTTDWDEMDEVEEDLDVGHGGGGGGESMDSEFDSYPHQQHQQGYHHPPSSHYRPQQHPNSGYGYRSCALAPHSPTSPQQNQHQQQQQQNSSSFTTSDPFYLATLRSTQANSTTSSSFLRPAMGFAASLPTSY